MASDHHVQHSDLWLVQSEHVSNQWSYHVPNNRSVLTRFLPHVAGIPAYRTVFGWSSLNTFPNNVLTMFQTMFLFLPCSYRMPIEPIVAGPV